MSSRGDDLRRYHNVETGVGGRVDDDLDDVVVDVGDEHRLLPGEDEEGHYGSLPVSASSSDAHAQPSGPRVLVRRPRLNRGSIFRQTLSALGYCLGAFAMGNMLGWSSTALPSLESSTSPLPITSAQGAWVGSLVCLGALVQGPLTGSLMNRFGRQRTMLLACLPLFLGWLLVILADSVWMLYAGRFVVGLAGGCFSVVAPVYIGEIAAPEIRGALGTLFQIMVVTGIFFMYSLGSYWSWKFMAGVCAVVPWVIFVMVFFLRDSPTSCLLRRRPELARKALVWLRNSADIDDELCAIQRSVDETRRSSAAGGLRFRSVLCVSDPAVRQPLLLSIFLMMNQQLSGVNAVITFTVNIFQSSGATLDPHYATIIVGAVQLTATLLSSLVVNHVGRRPTLLLTQIFMTAALVAFGGFFYVKRFSPDSVEGSYLQWIPLAALVVFIVAFSFGLGPLAWLMVGELLAPKIVSVAGPLASIVNWSLAFVVTAGFTYLNEWLGDFGTYWLFAAFGAVGIVITARYLPETRNKTLREIQDGFR